MTWLTINVVDARHEPSDKLSAFGFNSVQEASFADI